DDHHRIAQAWKHTPWVSRSHREALFQLRDHLLVTHGMASRVPLRRTPSCPYSFCRAQLPSTSRSARNGRMSEYMGESSCPLECLGHLLQLTRSPRSTNGATTPLPASLDRSLGLASRLCSSTLLRIAQFISLGLLRCCGRSLCRSASMTGRRRWNSGLRGVLRRLRNASSLCS
ncbi:hypothetical protein BHM03_00011426, partial [Ensete ventricosum]